MNHYVVPIYELNGKVKSYSMKVSPEEINLLEAAPDLLEACKDAYKLIALTRPDTCGYVLVKLSDAISKAEGGTK